MHKKLFYVLLFIKKVSKEDNLLLEKVILFIVYIYVKEGEVNCILDVKIVRTLKTGVSFLLYIYLVFHYVYIFYFHMNFLHLLILLNNYM